jgi:guanylate kinase
MEKKVVVIAGPSGSGKNTVIRMITQRYPKSVALTTATTRAARPSEREGSDYFFFDIDRFDRESSAGNIVGSRFVPLFGGIHYGIYLPDLRKKLASASVVFAPVDITGAQWLKETYGATTIFLNPETMSQIHMRIRSRSPEMSAAEFQMREKIAETEMHIHAPQYDYRVTSADGMLTQTVDEVLAILQKEGYTLS